MKFEVKQVAIMDEESTNRDLPKIAELFVDVSGVDLDDRAEDIQTMLETRRNGKLDILIGSETIAVSTLLGSGGSKEVYDVVILGEQYALAIPTITKGISVTVRQWKRVLQEPGNTDRARAAGFFVNSLCGIVGIKINKIDFPALVMRRYQDLSFEVRDRKNKHSSTGQTRIIPKGTPAMQIIDLMKPLGTDIRNLISKGVQIGDDSINLCIINSQPRLYLNDLGIARFEPIPELEIRARIHKYSNAIVGAIIEGVTPEEFDEFKEYFYTDREALQESIEAAASHS